MTSVSFPALRAALALAARAGSVVTGKLRTHSPVRRLVLNRDGSLNGQPRVVSPANYTFDPEMNEAVNRALRAVRTCDPIDRLPNDPVVGEYFDIWRDQEVTFGLRIQG